MFDSLSIVELPAFADCFCFFVISSCLQGVVWWEGHWAPGVYPPGYAAGSQWDEACMQCSSREKRAALLTWEIAVSPSCSARLTYISADSEGSIQSEVANRGKESWFKWSTFVLSLNRAPGAQIFLVWPIMFTFRFCIIILADIHRNSKVWCSLAGSTILYCCLTGIKISPCRVYFKMYLVVSEWSEAARDYNPG